MKTRKDQSLSIHNARRMEYLRTSVSSKGWHVQWEGSPTGGTVRPPVAWVASVEETKRMKPTDQVILGMVSESPGRNASEPTSGLEKNESRRPSPLVRGEGSRDAGTLTDAGGHFGGVVGTAR